MNLYNSLFKYVIGKKTSLKEVENRIISVIEDFEYTTDLKTKRELDALELKEKQNFVPSLINKYNVLTHKKAMMNNHDKKPIIASDGAKPCILRKLLPKNKTTTTKKLQDNLSKTTFFKGMLKVEETLQSKESKSKITIDKYKTINDNNSIADSSKSEKPEKSHEKNYKSKTKTSMFVSKKTNSTMELKLIDDYHIPSEDAKTHAKSPFNSMYIII